MTKGACQEVAELVGHAAEDLQQAVEKLRDTDAGFCLEAAVGLTEKLKAADAAALQVHACLREVQLRKEKGELANGRATLETQPLEGCLPSGHPASPEALATAAREVQEAALNATLGGQ